MVITEVVRASAAIIGIAGAVIAAPAAIPTLWKNTLRPTYYRLAMTQRSYRRPRDVTIHVGAAAMSIVGISGEATASIWGGPDATIEHLINILRQRTDALQLELVAVRGDVRRGEQNLHAKVDSTAAAIRSEIQQLSAGLELQEDKSKRIDAAGFPVIAVAFVLAGMPDDWVRHGWAAGVLLTLAGLITIAAAVPAILLARAQRADHRSS